MPVLPSMSTDMSRHLFFFRPTESLQRKALVSQLGLLTWWGPPGSPGWWPRCDPARIRGSSPRPRGPAPWLPWTPGTCSADCWPRSGPPRPERRWSRPPSPPCSPGSPAWWIRYCCCYFHSARHGGAKEKQDMWVKKLKNPLEIIKRFFSNYPKIRLIVEWRNEKWQKRKENWRNGVLLLSIWQCLGRGLEVSSEKD